MKRMPENEDRLAELVPGLKSGACRAYWFDTVSSTMDAAFNLEEELVIDRTLVISDVQTTGRGRYSRRWFSTCEDIIFSLILTEYDFRVPYSMLSAYAVYITLIKHKAPVMLKWINDVLWENGKKVSGVLTEECRNRTVIGIGVNLNSEEMPLSVREGATSYCIETGERILKEDFLSSLIAELFLILDRVKKGGITRVMNEWDTEADLRGKRVHVINDSGEFKGIAAGINKKTGALILNRDGGQLEIYEGSLFNISDDEY